jgi:hypothetical protein
MELKIEYSVDIVVGTLFQKQWKWYVTEKEIWILDQAKFGEAFIRQGYEIPEQADPERENLLILDEKNASTFLPKIEKFRVSYHVLQNVLRKKLPLSKWNDVIELFPYLFVNFDNFELWSVFPEFTSFE